MKASLLRRRGLLVSALGGLAAVVARPTQAAGDAPDPTPRPWPKDRATPPLSLPTHEGRAWSLAGARGRVVVLNFWASWCEPCRTEMPSLELLAQRHEGDGVIVMTVNFRDTDAALRRFLDAMPITLPILRDADGAAARAWQVRVFPTTIVVGRDGRAAFSVVGEADWTGAAARRWIAALL